MALRSQATETGDSRAHRTYVGKQDISVPKARRRRGVARRHRAARLVIIQAVWTSHGDPSRRHDTLIFGQDRLNDKQTGWRAVMLLWEWSSGVV